MQPHNLGQLRVKEMKKPKYAKYQDYVIKDGKFVGEFEQMYQDYHDPWEQTTRENYRSEKIIAIYLLKRIGAKKVIELGCGLGCYTQMIKNAGFAVLGIDISPTAINKAKQKHPNCTFQVSDILDFNIYREYKPDAIIMAEITWYILDQLDAFINFLRTEMPDVYLIHLLTTYPQGVQKYGVDKFTNLEEMMSYFNMNYNEFGKIGYPEGDTRTYFVGRYS